MAERKKGEMDGEQHSLSLANSSCEIPQRQDLPFMGTKDQRSAPARHNFLTSERPQWKGEPG